MYVRRKRRCGVYGTYERYIVGFFGHPTMYDIHKQTNNPTNKQTNKQNTHFILAHAMMVDAQPSDNKSDPVLQNKLELN